MDLDIVMIQKLCIIIIQTILFIKHLLYSIGYVLLIDGYEYFLTGFVQDLLEYKFPFLLFVL